MDELNAAIDDAAVSERITAIQDLVGRILARAEEEPAVIAGLDPVSYTHLDVYKRQEERLSKQRALELFDEGLLDTFEIGTFGLMLHLYLQEL